MRLRVEVNGNISEMMADHYRDGEWAVTTAMRSAQVELKADWRGQVVSAGLGVRLGNAIRGQTYPKGEPSMNAAALIWSKAPKITAAHEAGPLIRANNGIYLAIPTDAAGKGPGGRSLSPGEWQFTKGRKLRFVARPGKNPILVLDQGRISSRGLAAPNRGRRRRDGILNREQTIIIFTLVRQVKLAKRLNLMAAADRVAATLPARVVGLWKD